MNAPELQQVRAVAICDGCNAAWMGAGLRSLCPVCGWRMNWWVTDQGIALALVDAEVMDRLLDSHLGGDVLATLAEEGWDYDPSRTAAMRLRRIGGE